MDLHGIYTGAQDILCKKFQSCMLLLAVNTAFVWQVWFLHANLSRPCSKDANMTPLCS